MRQFKPWVNNLEKEATKIEEVSHIVQKVVFKVKGREEQSFNCMAYKNKQQITKGYLERQKNIKPFGIGTNFEDLKTNSAVSTVQRENVWQPYYELNLEEMDFKEKMMQMQQSKIVKDNMKGQDIEVLEQKLVEIDQKKITTEGTGVAGEETKGRKLNFKEILAEKERMQEVKDNEQVLDPFTVKVRKINDNMNVDELSEIMAQYGELQRVKIPTGEDGRCKGIAFATYKNKEDCTRVIDVGTIKYDFYEIPVEKATMSNKQMQMRDQRTNYRGDGGFRGGFRDRDGGDGERSYRPRDGDGGDRPRGRGGFFRGGRDGEGRGGYQRRDGEGGGYQRRDGEGGGYQRREGEGGGYQRREGEGYQRRDDFQIRRNPTTR